MSEKYKPQYDPDHIWVWFKENPGKDGAQWYLEPMGLVVEDLPEHIKERHNGYYVRVEKGTQKHYCKLLQKEDRRDYIFGADRIDLLEEKRHIKLEQIQDKVMNLIESDSLPPKLYNKKLDDIAKDLYKMMETASSP